MSSPSPVFLEVPTSSCPRTTVELSSVGPSPRHAMPTFQHASRCSSVATCCRVTSWIFSIILYIIEFFVYIWVSYSYIHKRYVIFGLSVGFLVVPMVIVAAVSLVWYYNLDRFHQRRRAMEPHNLEFIEYRKKFTSGTIFLHVLSLAVIYR